MLCLVIVRCWIDLLSQEGLARANANARLTKWFLEMKSHQGLCICISHAC